jgi:selenocysteine-specific elongation factor
MSFIIGTAGHIDHGKTSLVKALTGQDTDRLKEEKERGISIELGFASLDLPDGTRAGVVDVPGHERFIRTMLAGSHGIDLVLFTVAADDGVMPQTEEHLDILHLLGIERAIFVVTKCDLVTEDRLRTVEDEIAILTAGTSLEHSPVVRFSSLTGQGLDELRRRIADTLTAAAKPQPPGEFRLPIDRVFVLQGHGLIVTGTAISGSVAVGDRVRCLPGDGHFRVRSLHVHNTPVRTAAWGQRIALNLSGQDRPSIERGQVICHESLTLTTDRFDALLEMPPTSVRPLKNHQRVRVHLGTAERAARIVLLGERDADRSADAYCQLVLRQPVLAMRGDHFVIRDETAQRTLGGGVVIHPWAPRHKRADSALRTRLDVFSRGSLPAVVTALLNEGDRFAVPTLGLRHFLNRSDADVRTVVDGIDGVHTFRLEDDRLYTTSEKWQRLERALHACLRDFHANHPLSPGMDLEALRDKLPMSVPSRVFRAVVDELVDAGLVAREASLLRLPGHTVRLRDEEQQLADRIARVLAEAPMGPPDLSQLEKTIGGSRARLTEVLKVMERQGTIVRISSDLYFNRESITRMKTALCERLPERSVVTPAAFRDLFGTSRKYTIPLLEYLDREGVTIRIGDTRRLAGPSLPRK